MHDQEFFGSDAQQSMMRKAAAVWQLVHDDIRFQSHGRAVGLNAKESQDIETHMALARLQGVSAIDSFPVGNAEAYIKDLEASGFKTDRFEVWQSGPDALLISREIERDNTLLKDLKVVSVDSSTSREKLAALAELTQSCEVLLPMGQFMRGVARPSVCLFAQDESGTPVGSSAAVAAFHPESANGASAWWGMLATHFDRRGERIALQLGAKSMIAMNEQHGYETFNTGIRAGNTASQKLCSKLGLTQTDECVIIAVDPEGFAGDRLTK